MVQEWKKQKVKEITQLIEKYPVIGMLDMCNLPSAQLQSIKSSIKDKARILMTKKRVIKLAIEKSKKTGITSLLELEVHEPALIFSDDDPFVIGKLLDRNTSEAYAKGGDTIQIDIVIPQGKTNLPPGPVISDLQKAGIKAQIQGNNITILQDAHVVKPGDVINNQLAGILMKFEIKPMQVKLNLVGAYEKGVVYKKEILEVNEEEYIDKLQTAFRNALNLAYNADYIIKETIELKLAEASRNAMNLALNAEIYTKETIESLLQKAESQAKALKSKIPEQPLEKAEEKEAKAEEKKEVKEEPKEEKPEDEEKKGGLDKNEK